MTQHDNNREDVKKATPERFWTKIGVAALSDCWIWLAFFRPTYPGYNIKGDGKWRSSYDHRLMYEFMFDSFDKKLEVLHTCDNPKCVNPNHLWQGTQADNIKDMMEKGRKSYNNGSIGSKNPRAKINEGIVLKIKTELANKKLSHKQVAKMFNVSKQCVDHINANNTWTHVSLIPLKNSVLITDEAGNLLDLINKPK